MTVNSKTYEFYNSINSCAVWLLLFLASISYSNAGCADELAVIAKINSFARVDEAAKIKIVDEHDGRFNLIASMPIDEDVIEYFGTRFTIKDTHGNTRLRMVDLSDDFTKLRSTTGKSRRHPVDINVRFDEEDVDMYRDFIVEYMGKKKSDDKGAVVYSISGKMPELKCTLLSSEQAGLYDTLKIRKKDCSDSITVTDISGSEYIEVINNLGTIELAKDRSSVDIGLKLTPEALKETSDFKDYIKIEYKVNGRSIIGFVEVSVKVKAVCPQCTCNTKVDPIEPLTYTIESPPSNSIYVGYCQTVQYEFTNNLKDKEIPLSMAEFKRPIYRDYFLGSSILSKGKNCGDKLQAGDSCVLKLQVYPTGGGNIEETLDIAPGTLDPLELSIMVQDAVDPLLRIIPVPQDGADGIIVDPKFSYIDPHGVNKPVGSIQSVVMPYQEKITLQYRLENYTDSNFQIGGKDIGVPWYLHSYYNYDPEFTVKHDCQNLWAHDGCNIEVTYIPNNISSAREITGINRELQVKFNKSGKVTIPILITRDNTKRYVSGFTDIAPEEIRKKYEVVGTDLTPEQPLNKHTPIIVADNVKKNIPIVAAVASGQPLKKYSPVVVADNTKKYSLVATELTPEKPPKKYMAVTSELTPEKPLKKYLPIATVDAKKYTAGITEMVPEQRVKKYSPVALEVSPMLPIKKYQEIAVRPGVNDHLGIGEDIAVFVKNGNLAEVMNILNTRGFGSGAEKDLYRKIEEYKEKRQMLESTVKTSKLLDYLLEHVGVVKNDGLGCYIRWCTAYDHRQIKINGESSKGSVEGDNGSAVKKKEIVMPRVHKTAVSDDEVAGNSDF